MTSEPTSAELAIIGHFALCGDVCHDWSVVASRMGADAIAAMIERGFLELWAIACPQVTLSPLAAEMLGIEIAERMSLKSESVCEDDEWREREVLIEEPYWVRCEDDPDYPHVYSDDIDAIRRQVKAQPGDLVLPKRRYECPLPFPDMVASNPGVPMRENVVKMAKPMNRRERRQAARKAG